MTIFYVDLYGSYCGLLSARTLQSARKQAMAQHGSNNLRGVRYATEADLASVSSMGGHIPDGKIASGEIRIPNVKVVFGREVGRADVILTRAQLKRAIKESGSTI